MFKKNRKGQGALEYLLLIGGAVLIAVIVIALLVGMGGQSRETANTQAENAQQSLDMPQPASIVAIEALDITDEPAQTGCSNNFNPINCKSGATNHIKLNWQELGDSGVYTLKVFDYSGNEQTVEVYDKATGAIIPNNNITGQTPACVTVRLGPDQKCGDSYWAEITTEKNGKFVTSVKQKFSWSD